MNISPGAIAALCAVLGLLGGFIVYAMRQAFTQGKNEGRLSSLEQSVARNDGCEAQLAAVNATLSSVQASIDDLRHNVKNLWQAQPASTRKRGGEGD